MIPGHLVSTDDGASTEPPEAVLKAFRKEIRERIGEREQGRAAEKPGVPDAPVAPPVAQPTPAATAALRRVRHVKYGAGVFVSEDEETVTVRFEAHGEKTFAKAFSTLEEVQG